MKKKEIETIKPMLKELKALEPSKSNKIKLIDIGLDVYNYVQKTNLEHKELFLTDWRISIDKFAELEDEDFNMNDIEKYWNDHLEEMLFDLKTLLRKKH